MHYDGLSNRLRFSYKLRVYNVIVIASSKDSNSYLFSCIITCTRRILLQEINSDLFNESWTANLAWVSVLVRAVNCKCETLRDGERDIFLCEPETFWELFESLVWDYKVFQTRARDDQSQLLDVYTSFIKTNKQIETFLAIQHKENNHQ